MLRFLLFCLLVAMIFSSSISRPEYVSYYSSHPTLIALRLEERTARSGLVLPDLAKYKCEDCWAGYAVNASSGSISSVIAKVRIPSLNCTEISTASTFFVGLDGFTSSDFAYSEVYALCAAGSAVFGAEWYDSITEKSGMSSWVPKAGDVVLLSVIESKGSFHFNLSDISTNQTTIGSSNATGAGLTSAECATGMAPGFPLSDFGKVHFSACDAEIDEMKEGIGAFVANATLDKFVCYNSNGTLILAKPSALEPKSKLNSFSVLFKESGP
jgi:hypothetical protein